jgi:peptidoglycan pentaglycine glycine transferase (the first glycine)
MDIVRASHQQEWDDFLSRQPWGPFLQSWTMGEVYEDIGQKAIRIEAREGGVIRAVCFAHLVPARRGRHLSVPYGPVIDEHLGTKERAEFITGLLAMLKTEARNEHCTFVRLAPFWPEGNTIVGTVTSPLHLLAEHVWYLPLKTENGTPRGEEEILMQMRKTTRNLVRRAERDGVTIEKSGDPEKDLAHFLRLHEETRQRHKFTPYSDTFFRSQVRRFAARGECTVYLARFQSDVIAASVHMHAFGETSYHHGASSGAHQKIPASYLLQWTAIRDALKRGDRLYNFWGIAPLDAEGHVAGKLGRHPFGGVTLFKTGFGGMLQNLTHCTDVPVNFGYWLTYAFEMIRKWRRGF